MNLRNIFNEVRSNFIFDISDKGTFHSYIEQYEIIFSPYLEVLSLNILEIGIAQGSSLIIWNEYFSNAKRIVGIDNGMLYDELENGIIFGKKGIDILPEFKTWSDKLDHIYESYPKITAFHKENAYSIDCIKKMKNLLDGEKFDIIIDDGSHNINDAQFVLEYYGTLLLNDGGVIVIEDVPGLTEANVSYPNECYFYKGPNWSDDTLLFVKKVGDV